MPDFSFVSGKPRNRCGHGFLRRRKAVMEDRKGLAVMVRCIAYAHIVAALLYRLTRGAGTSAILGTLTGQASIYFPSYAMIVSTS